MTRTGFRFITLFLLALLCAGSALGDSVQTSHKKKHPKKVELPPLPSGPTGRPVPQYPLENMTAVTPQVTYVDGQLTIVAPNSTLGDILRAIHKQTGAEMEIPPNATERVVTNLGPGPAREVVAELLNGSRFNYVLLGSPENMDLLTRVVLVAKSAEPGAPTSPSSVANRPVQRGIAPIQDDAASETAEATDDSADDNPEEPEQNAATAAEAEQQQPAADPQAVKTPQQMLQEMQQRQMQLQQQQGQQAGQPAQPGMPQPPVPLQRVQPDPQQQPPEQ